METTSSRTSADDSYHTRYALQFVEPAPRLVRRMSEGARMVDFDGERDVAVMATVKENVYWEFVVTGCRCTNRPRIAGSLINLIGTMWFLIIISVYLLPPIAGNQIEELTNDRRGHNQLSDWKSSEKDGAAVDFEGKSRAFWACSGRDWSWEEAALAEYNMYSAHSLPFGMFADGQLFGIVAIILWSALIIQEFNLIINYALLLFMPTRKVGNCIVQSTDGAILQAIPAWVKIVIVLVIIVRFTINCFLGIYGLRFLAYTVTLKDFILNSVALGFIYDIDELVYSLFVAASKKRHLSELGQIEVSNNKWLINLQDRYIELVNVFLLVIIVFVVNSAHLSDFATSIRDNLFCNVCSGDEKSNWGFEQCNTDGSWDAFTWSFVDAAN